MLFPSEMHKETPTCQDIKKGFDKKNIFDRYNPDYTVIIVHCISSYSMRNNNNHLEKYDNALGCKIAHNAIYSLWIANLNCRTQNIMFFRF